MSSAEKTKKWEIFEIELKGPKHGNPFVDVEIMGIFRHESGETREVKGFYDDEGIYKIRFMPFIEGLWRFSVKSNLKELNNYSGEFVCEEPYEGNHGPVKVCNTYHFCYSDGKPFLPFGTTLYAWIYQDEKVIRQTLESLKKSPFNKVRMCVFPKYFVYNTDPPPFYPLTYIPEEGVKSLVFNVRFFKHLENLVEELMKMNIEADLILFHPYDKWGFSKMPPEIDKKYLQYVIARFSAFRNIWWSLANEYDLIKPEKDWDDYFQFVRDNDPYGHPRSIHQCFKFYDHSKPWVTHASIQWQGSLRSWSGEAGMDIGVKLIPKWRERYQKPVIVDECGYEGDIEYGWGNLPPQELVNRIWEGVTSGGYVTHGETYHSDDEILWWSKGGKLRGQSVERIAFLRKLLEEAPPFLEPQKLDPVMDWDVHCIGKEGEFYLIYFDVNQPSRRSLKLPAGRFKVDLIDCWEMKIHTIGIFQGLITIVLPGKPYCALRIQRINLFF